MIWLLAQVAATSGDSSLLPAGIGAAGSVVAVLGLAKGIGSWLREQLDKKDTLFAAKDAELSRVNAAWVADSARRDFESDKRLETCRAECAAERRKDRDELVAILKQAAGHSGSGGV